MMSRVDHRALALQQAGYGMDDGVGDVALGEKDGHRPAQADYHGGRHHAGHALAELGAGLGNAHAGENHSHNSHGHVDRGDLRQPPFPPEGTHHREDNGGQEHHNDSHRRPWKSNPSSNCMGAVCSWR